MRSRPTRRWSRSTSRTIRSSAIGSTGPARCAVRPKAFSTRSSLTTAAPACMSARIPTIAKAVVLHRPATTQAWRPSVAEPGGILVGPARDADLPAVLDLYAQPDFDDGRVLSTEEARRLLARFADYPDYVLYVAEIDGKIVGSFALLVMENLGHLGRPSAIVEDVVVA